MKRLNRFVASTILALSAALFASPAAAQIAFVKTIGTTQTTSPGTSTTITVPAAGVAVGNSVIVALAMDPASGAVSCGDTRGNVYTSDRDVANGSGTSGVRTVVLSAHNIIALTSGNTISCTHPSVTARALSANEFSGLVSTSTVDAAASATGNSTSPSSGNTSTTTQASELLIGGIGVEGPSDDSFTAGANYTAIGRAGTIGGSAASNITVNPEYRIVSATSAYAATGSLGRTSRQWSAAIVTYKAAAPVATKLAITSINGGSNPTAGVGFAVVVQSQNASGTPANVISATAVSLSLKTGTGTLGGSLTGTIAAGTNQVTITGVTYTKAESGVVITATRTSGDSLTAGDSAAFTVVVPGAATKLAFSIQPGNSTAGSPLTGPLTVVVQDSLGNTVTSSTAAITVVIGTNPGGGSLSGTTPKNASGGVASFSDLSIDKSGTGYTLTASAAGLTSATSIAFDISAAAATKLGFLTQPINSVVGAPFGALIVVVQDNFSNIVTSSTALITIAIGNNPGGGTLSGTTSKNALSGAAAFVGHTIDKSGIGYTIIASATGLTSAITNPCTLFAGAAAKVAFTTQPANATIGSALGGPPTAAVQDTFGNTVTSSTASITVAIGTNPGGGTLSGTTTKNAVAGVASFNDLNIDQAGIGYTLAASATGLTGATSNGFNIIALMPDLVVTSVSNPPATALLGGSFNVTDTTANSGNGSAAASITSYRLSLDNVITTSDPLLTGTRSVPSLGAGANSSGSVTVTISTSLTPGTYYLGACADNGSVVSESNESNNCLASTSTVIVSASPVATKLVITSINGGSNPTAGIGFSVVVQSQNASGSPTNVASATGVSLSLKTGTGTLGGTLTGTIAAGTSQVTITGVTYTKAESGVVVMATRTSGDTLTAGDSAAFTIIPGAATTLAVSVQPGSSTAGSALSGPPTVVVRDNLGNTVTSSTASITVALGANPGGSTLSGTATKNASSGVATFNDLSLNKAGTGYTLTATSAGLTATTSSAFNISAGAATALVFTTQPGSVTAGTNISGPPTVTVQDSLGNTVTSSAASITVAIGTNPGGGTLSGTTPKNASSGEASYSDLSINKAGAGYTLTASATGLMSATSSTFNITAAAASKVAFTTQPANATAGSALGGPPTVTVQDNLGNTVTSSTAPITVAIGTNPSGGTLSGTTTVNASSGVATFTGLSINQVGNGYTLTAAATGLTGATSNGFNITSGSGGGTIAGVITRVSNGSTITGALVEAYQGTTLLGSAITNSSGSYSITGLATGTNTVRASFTGLVPQTLNNVTVASGSTTTINLSLNFGIAVQAPVAGAVVNDFSVLVTGLFNTSLAPEVGIQVNGYVALQDGDEFAAMIPIDAQTTTLTAAITDTAGNLIAGDAVPITPQLPNAAPLLFFRPSPAIALVSQPVGFTLTSVNPFTQIQLDGNGDGTIDYTGGTLQGVTVNFAASGLYFPTVSVTEQDGSVRTATTIVQVFDSGQLDTLLQTKWAAMKNALRLGNVSGAVSHIVMRRRATYEAMFNALTVPLANIDQVLTSITFLDQRGIEAEYEMMVNQGGTQYSYMVLFAIDEDGVWRVKFF